MINSEILREVRQELKENIDEKYRADNQRYYKKKISCYGVRTPVVRKIAKKYFKQIKFASKAKRRKECTAFFKYLDKNQIFVLCEKLFKNRYNEEATIAIQWVNDIQSQFERADFEVFENWLAKYIDNWGKDDDFCLHIINPMIGKYPELIEKVKLWSHSKNMWLRRASAVSFITTDNAFYITKHNLKDIFEVARLLLNDKEDLVQKGYGWMLKAASIHNQKPVFDFVMKHKDIMPRTALRYAIEKMPTNFKKQAMKKYD